jgi:hypothetical protein
VAHATTLQGVTVLRDAGHEELAAEIEEAILEVGRRKK